MPMNLNCLIDLMLNFHRRVPLNLCYIKLDSLFPKLIKKFPTKEYYVIMRGAICINVHISFICN